MIGETAVGVQKFAKFAWSAPALRPTKIPSTTNAKSESVFADVKMFWMSLPNERPRVFTNVKRTMITIATNCWVERLIA